MAKDTQNSDDKKINKAGAARKGRNATKNAAKGGKSADKDAESGLKRLGKLFGG